MSSYLLHYEINYFLFSLISYFQATAVSKILKFRHQNLRFLIGGLLLMISVFVFTKWGVKHGNVIYKFVTDNNNIIPFHYVTNSETKQTLTEDCFSPLNAYRNLFGKKSLKITIFIKNTF